MSPRRAALETLSRGWPRHAAKLSRETPRRVREAVLPVAREMSRRFGAGEENWAAGPWTEVFGPPEEETEGLEAGETETEAEAVLRRLEALLEEAEAPPSPPELPGAGTFWQRSLFGE